MGYRYRKGRTIHSNFLAELGESEKEFTQKVFETYGKCTIDPETGEITKIDWFNLSAPYL